MSDNEFFVQQVFRWNGLNSLCERKISIIESFYLVIRVICYKDFIIISFASQKNNTIRAMFNLNKFKFLCY